MHFQSVKEVIYRFAHWLDERMHDAGPGLILFTPFQILAAT
jgi:hypothetical protein